MTSICPGDGELGVEELNSVGGDDISPALESSSASGPSGSASEPSEWTLLVEKIQAGKPEGMEELYQIFGRGVRFYLYRQLGSQDLDDKVHDTFLIVLHAIRNGDIREPERLMGFVRTVVRRRVASHIDEMVHNRREHTAVESGIVLIDRNSTPEESAIGKQQKELVARILGGLNSRDREVLTRFYLLEQTQEQICEEMSLTATQFRLLKSRAKARFGETGRRRLERKSPDKIVLRTITGLLH